jgi:hypothetical protein
MKIAVRLSGMEMPIATIKIQKFVDVLTAETDLLCPKCKQKPKWNGGYDCTCCPVCGKPMESHVVDEKGTVNWKCPEDGWQQPSHYNHWSQLLRVDKATGEPIVKTKFTEPDKDVVADAFIMEMEDFSKIADGTLDEYGVTVMEETSAINLRKLLIATQNLRKVVLIKYLDTYEERIAILTTSISQRIILKEILPLNLADVKETMRINLSGVTEQDLAEAEQFVKMLPKAKEDLLYVSDYRTKGIKAKLVTPKVMELEAILSKAKTSK